MSAETPPEPKMHRVGFTRFDWGGHTFVATPTGDTGIHTGRRRFHVWCETCYEVLHENTTGPVENAKAHLWRIDRDRRKAAQS